MVDEKGGTEDYQDSLMKCQRINKIIPVICDNIKQMQALDKRYEADGDLKSTQWILNMLEKVEVGDGGVMAYVDDYRERLGQGLTHLSDFFDRLGDLQGLDEEQRVKMSHLVVSIANSQDLIVHIVSV